VVAVVISHTYYKASEFRESKIDFNSSGIKVGRTQRTAAETARQIHWAIPYRNKDPPAQPRYDRQDFQHMNPP